MLMGRAMATMVGHMATTVARATMTTTRQRITAMLPATTRQHIQHITAIGTGAWSALHMPIMAGPATTAPGLTRGLSIWDFLGGGGMTPPPPLPPGVPLCGSKGGGLV